MNTLGNVGLSLLSFVGQLDRTYFCPSHAIPNIIHCPNHQTFASSNRSGANKNGSNCDFCSRFSMHRLPFENSEMLQDSYVYSFVNTKSFQEIRSQTQPRTQGVVPGPQKLLNLTHLRASTVRPIVIGLVLPGLPPHYQIPLQTSFVLSLRFDAFQSN